MNSLDKDLILNSVRKTTRVVVTYEECKTGGATARSRPLARKLAREHGLAIDQIEGTGPEGAVVVADVRRLLAGRDEETPHG